MELARDLASAGLVIAGLGFFTAATIGLLRFPDALCRLHAVAKADTAGLGLVIAGSLMQAGSVATVGKLAAIGILALVASATSSQLIGRFAHRRGRGA